MEAAVLTVEKDVDGRQERLSVRQMLDLIDKMPPVSLEEGFRAAEAIRSQVRSRGVPEMTMEEIDEEIAQCRRERKQWELK